MTLVASLTLAVLASADPTPIARLGWTVNGSVDAAARLGNTLYVGGDFTRISPFSAVLGAFYGLSPVTGAPTGTFPLVDGTVSAVEPDGAGGYYIGGSFSTVGGHARPGLARVRSDGTVDPDFLPDLDINAVRWIARDSGRVFIKGFFRSVGGLPRPGLAAVDGTSGAVTPWVPAIAAGDKGIFAAGRLVVIGLRSVVITVKPLNVVVVAEAWALDLTSGAVQWQRTLGSDASFAGDVIGAGTSVIVGGSFGSGGCLAWLDASTGESTSMPNLPSCSTGGSVHSLALVGDTLYVGGSLGQRSNAAAVDLTTGAVTSWNPQPNGSVSALAVSPTGSVYLGGTFSTVGGQLRDGLAEIDASDTLTGWMANAFPRSVNEIEVTDSGTVIVGSSLAVSGGAPRRHLAAFDLLTGTLLDWAPAADRPIKQMAARDRTVFIAGSFESVNGVGRRNLAALDDTTAALLPWNPNSLNYSLLVTSMLVHEDYVYLAGFLSSAGLRRVHRVSGTIDAGWAPNPNVGPAAMMVHDSALYIGGRFSSVGAESRSGLAAVDLSSGTVTSWNPGVSGSVSALALDDTTLYVGGLFTSLAGQPRSNLGGVNIHTGAATPWSPLASADGEVSALAIADGRVIVGGLFTTVGGQPRRGTAAVNVFGAVVEWNPDIGRPRRFVVGEADLISVGTADSYGPVLSGIDVFALSGSGRPANLRAQVTGGNVLLSWSPPASGSSPTGYVIEAGSVSGSDDLALLGQSCRLALSAILRTRQSCSWAAARLPRAPPVSGARSLDLR